MPKLCQVVAIQTAKRPITQSKVTELYRRIQKQDLFNGFVRRYTPKDEEGEVLPDENKRIQATVDKCLEDFANTLGEMLDTVLTVDVANTNAVADITVDGYLIASRVPVTHLLFLEKQLVDIRSFLSSLPVLDPASSWVDDGKNDYWRAEPVTTVRTKKIRKSFVAAPATDKHPAQVEVYTEDEPVGTWTKTDISGAIPSTEKEGMISKVNNLIEAVKAAREEANATEVVRAEIGESLFSYLLS